MSKSRIRDEKEILVYSLLKNYETPTSTIHAGVRKTESEWACIFKDLQSGDCYIKKDWFDGCYIYLASIDLSEKEYDFFSMFMSIFFYNVEYTTCSSGDGSQNEVKTTLEVLLKFIDLLEKAQELR